MYEGPLTSNPMVLPSPFSEQTLPSTNGPRRATPCAPGTLVSGPLVGPGRGLLSSVVCCNGFASSIFLVLAIIFFLVVPCHCQAGTFCAASLTKTTKLIALPACQEVTHGTTTQRTPSRPCPPSNPGRVGGRAACRGAYWERKVACRESSHCGYVIPK